MVDTQVRLLEFGNADLGMLYNLEDIGPDGALWVSATGTVEMPASARLLLANRQNPFDLSPLARFAPDDLCEIDLEISKVRDADLRHIAHLTGLQTLDLSLTAITDAAIPHIERLHGLQWLGLYNCRISRDGIRRLRQALPNCVLSGLPDVTIARLPPLTARDRAAIADGMECDVCGNRTFVSDRIDYVCGEKILWFQCTNCVQQIGVPYVGVRWQDAVPPSPTD